MLLIRKRITLFIESVADKRKSASLIAGLAGLMWLGDAAPKEIKREEVGAQEQTSASIDYRNTETIDISSLSLVTRGVAGRRDVQSQGGTGLERQHHR